MNSGNTQPTSSQGNTGPVLPPKRTRVKRLLGRAAKAGGRYTGRKLKSLGKGAARGIATAPIAGLAAAATLAAGLTTGDPSKTAQFVGAGLGLSSALGKKVSDSATDFSKGKISTLSNAYNEEMYGYKGAKERRDRKQNKVARKEFLKDKEERRKYSELAGKINYKGDIKELMNAAADYKEAGVDDDKVIKNALKLENDNGGINQTNHKQIVDVAAFAEKNKFGRDYVEDDDKRKSLDTKIDKLVTNTNDRKQVKKFHAELYDVGHLRP